MGIDCETTVRRGTLESELLVQTLSFPDKRGGCLSDRNSDWTRVKLERLNYYLIEFVVHIRQPMVGELQPLL